MVLGIQINKSGVWEAVSQTSYIFILSFTLPLKMFTKISGS